jgi:hypothetical protein
MMRQSALTLLVASACLLAIGCPQSSDDAELNSQSLNDQLLRAATEYKSWGVVVPNSRVAPMYCRAPGPASSEPRFSASADLETHGQKLYFLFAKNKDEYLDRGGRKAASIGQEIVKESWIAGS